MSNIRIFGSRAFIRNPTPCSKLEVRSLEGVFVGHSINKNASRVYIPETRKVLNSKDVKIDETILYRDMTKNSPTLTNEIDVINNDSGNSLITDGNPCADELIPQQEMMANVPIPTNEPDVLGD